MKIASHILLLLLVCFNTVIFSQTNIQEKDGTITFVSSQYFYVKFENTDGIKTGDTLFVRQNKKLLPVLNVQFISSKSAAATLVGNKKLNVGDKLIAKVMIKIEEQKVEKSNTINQALLQEGEVLPPTGNQKILNKKKSEVSGRLSVQSYSSLSNTPGSIDYQRWRYSLSLDADRIRGSNFSITSYINFNYRADDWSNVSTKVWNNLKVYDLAFKYEFDEKTNIIGGRYRNRNISNIGSIDGIGFEKRFNSYYAGAVIGYRPDLSDLSFNPDLFEFGGYVGRTDTLGAGFMENNFAFMEQTNKFKTDRRFIYLQHSNNILTNTYFFASSEIDLYKKIVDVESNELTLTSIFFSVRYSPTRIFSATLSYDARKNVVYYETYKNFIDSLFENETRQGFNLRTNFRLTNNLFLGLNGGYRFRNGDLDQTKNFGGYLSYSSIPVIESSVAVNYNKLFTSYINSSIVGIRLTKYFFNNNVDFSFGYRVSKYDLTTFAFSSNQNILSIDLSTRLNRTISLSVSYEGIFDERSTFTRIFAGLTTRF